MGMRRNPSAAVTVDKDGHFGQGRLDDQGIGNNADIRAKAHKFDALDGIPHFFKLSSKSKGAKSFLFHFFPRQAVPPDSPVPAQGDDQPFL